MKTSKRSVFVLALALTANYGFLDIKGIFYNLLKTALSLSDQQMGTLWSVYGIASLCCFLFGGILADIVSPKKLICLATAMATVLHLCLAAVLRLVLRKTSSQIQVYFSSGISMTLKKRKQ